MNVELHDLAAAELREATTFYEERADGLGEAFLDEIDHALTLIADSPRVGTPGSHATRWLILRRFPFSVVYRISDAEILVVAVAHHRRQPNYWSDRR